MFEAPLRGGASVPDFADASVLLPDAAPAAAISLACCSPVAAAVDAFSASVGCCLGCCETCSSRVGSCKVAVR